jgi:hypothetical protein
MTRGPEQVPDNSEESSWEDWKDYHAPDKSSHFEYNPAASEITDQSGKFPESDDFEPPEKM